MYWTLTPEEQSVIASLNTIFQEEFTKISQPSIPDELVMQLEKLSLEETITQMDKFGLELVGFLKRVSDFHTLDVNDQQALLKANATVCLMVIASSTYSRERGAYLKGDKAVPPGLYGQALGIDMSAHYAEFSHSLKTILGDDYTAFPLVACFVIFDPLASDVSDRQTVSFFRDKYTLLLKHYLDSRYSYMFAGQYLDAVYTTLRQGKLAASKFTAALSNWKNMMDPLMVELMNLS